ncbi:RNA recognition motif domain-containing protein [Methylomagnum sp.]
MMNIYVGNLSYQVTNEDLREAFARFGEVGSANVVIDKLTNRSKGFGFVEMPDHASGEEAIKQLDDQPLKGRNIRVNEARPRENQGGGGGFPPRRGAPRRA